MKTKKINIFIATAMAILFLINDISAKERKITALEQEQILGNGCLVCLPATISSCADSPNGNGCTGTGIPWICAEEGGCQGQSYGAPKTRDGKCVPPLANEVGGPCSLQPKSAIVKECIGNCTASSFGECGCFLTTGSKGVTVKYNDCK
jgi:hypothetical protein